MKAESHHQDMLMGKAATGKVPKQLKDATAKLVEKSNKGLGMKWATSKAFSVRLPPHLEAWVESLENRSEWIREALAEKYEREQAKLVQSDRSSTP